jgi:hypothetical protein
MGAVQCPSCGALMNSLALDAHLGTRVELDICAACQVIWFDRLENLRLTPGATLQLFRMIGEQPRSGAGPHGAPLPCPRCGIRLLLTNDRQRNTAFRYWRCGKGHGRLITYFDFLREKDFIRPLSPQQIEELRRNVQTVNCSNCGGPIDLVQASVCAHCGTPVSMLDLTQIGAMAGQLERADRVARAPNVDAMFETIRRNPAWQEERAPGLVDVTLALVSRWLNSTE